VGGGGAGGGPGRARAPPAPPPPPAPARRPLLASALPQVKEAFDDIGRHRSDKEVNGRRVTLVREEGEVLVKWADVQVGGGGAVAGRACRQPPWYSALAS